MIKKLLYKEDYSIELDDTMQKLADILVCKYMKGEI